MKALKKIVLNEYVELSNQHKKWILGGADDDGGDGDDACEGTNVPCNGSCPEKLIPPGIDNKGNWYPAQYVSQSCKAQMLGSPSSLVCYCG